MTVNTNYIRHKNSKIFYRELGFYVKSINFYKARSLLFLLNIDNA